MGFKTVSLQIPPHFSQKSLCHHLSIRIAQRETCVGYQVDIIMQVPLNDKLSVCL